MQKPSQGCAGLGRFERYSVIWWFKSRPRELWEVIWVLWQVMWLLGEVVWVL